MKKENLLEWIYINPVKGEDEADSDIYEPSGAKEAIYNVEGPITLSNQKEPTLLTKEGKYTITVTTVDNAGNPSEPATYTAELKGITATDVKQDTNKAYYYGKNVNGYECPNSEGVTGWKLFYAGDNPGIETDNIYIITEDYVSYDYLPKAGSNALVLANDKYHLLFSNVIKSYSGSSSVTAPRIKGLNNDYYAKGRSSTANSAKAVAYMLDINIWNNGFKGEKGEYAIGCPTIELYLKSYNEKYNTNMKASAVDNYGYTVSYDGGTTWYQEDARKLF